MNQKEHFVRLFRRYVEKQCTASEKQELMDYIDSGKYDLLLSKLISEQWEGFSEESFPLLSLEKKLEEDKIETFHKIKHRLDHKKSIRWRRIRVVAAVLLILTTCIWFVTNHTKRQHLAVHKEQINKKSIIPPGSNKAVLTLSNGKTIVLDSAQAGQLAIQGNRRIMKVDTGLLSFTMREKEEGDRNQKIGYNILRTPRGGQYKLILPDGSKVWVNSASFIKFPTAFNGKYREVEIQGQCYFEIAKDPSKPFKVKISSPASGQKGSEVLVLGTHFDVMAYPDEPAMNISILEGSVKVRTKGSKNKGVIIVPGQQAQVNKEGQIKLVDNVDMGAVVAWKDGFFEFDNTSLPVIMRQLARWYNIEVEYRQRIDGNKRFGGIISRNLPLSEILRMLEANGIYCQLQGHKLTVDSIE